MKLERMYCGACDHEVQVLVTDAPASDGQAPLLDSELVCLEIGERCSGSMCPLGAEAPAGMVTRFVRHGLSTDELALVSAFCAECGRETECVLANGEERTCVVCGTRSGVGT